MSKEVEEIIQLGKDSIVQMAIDLLGEKMRAENFAEIKVLTNGKEVFVSFLNPIKYLPINSVFYCDAGVGLLGQSGSIESLANPEGYSINEPFPFYQPNEDTKRNIQFVLEAIDNMEASDVDNFEDEMIIRENEEYYDISVVSEYVESWYKIKKVTGEMYDVGHAHLEPMSVEANDDEIYKEISFAE
ncbi:hypothetical protein [Labilibaculum filiforme]|nr:hypothetical protein [Labilibaculum filiforme]